MQNGYTYTGHTEKIWMDMLVHLTDEKSIQKPETKTALFGPIDQQIRVAYESKPRIHNSRDSKVTYNQLEKG